MMIKKKVRTCLIELIANLYKSLPQKAIRIFDEIPTTYKQEIEYIIHCYVNYGIPSALNYDYEMIKNKTISFVNSMKVGQEPGVYKYSPSTNVPNMYSSTCACMILSLYDNLNIANIEKKKWGDYLNSFQSKEDGLYYDSSISNELFNDSDWWGARHYVPHVIIALTNLGKKPKYKFKFLEKYYDKDFIHAWLNSFDWNGAFPHSNDIDNKLMNIGVALQYSRDFFCDEKADKSIKWIVEFLYSKINHKTGMWGKYDIMNPDDLSRCIQFAYHLFPLFLYDDNNIQHKEIIIDLAIKNQNVFGGFGVSLNSSACEDIDSIDILVRLSKQTPYREDDVKKALRKALPWVLSNMNEDGGFVFKRNHCTLVGHQEMSSRYNESNIFYTWFRSLCLAYLVDYIEMKNNFKIGRTPGYEY